MDFTVLLRIICFLLLFLTLSISSVDLVLGEDIYGHIQHRYVRTRFEKEFKVVL